MLILGPPVKFGDDPNLTDEQCHYLLRKYMPAHVTRNKILQQLFIKYIHNIVVSCYDILFIGIWKEGASLWKVFQDFVSIQVYSLSSI